MPRAKKEWLDNGFLAAHNAFVDWWNSMAARYGLQPASATTRDFLIGHFFNCRKDTRHDDPFNKLDVLEEGLKRCVGRFSPTLTWCLVKSKERGYGVIDLYEKGMQRSRAASSDDALVRKCGTGG